jgi:transcriptional regulator with XRE-family HTH domain
MNTATQSFGRRLRSQRERLGISLEAIASSTRIGRPLLADLERGDLSKWPGGIYRRSFVREYAAAIELSPEEVLAELLELFPEEGAPAVARPPASRPGSALRLTFVEDRTEALVGAARRLLAAMVELGAVLGLGWLLSIATGFDFLMVSGAIALTYYPIAAACSVRVPVLGWQRVRSLLAVPERAYDVPSSGDLIQLVLQQTPVQGADERPA